MTLTQTPFLGKLTTDGATLLWAQGYRPRDRVFIPFGYNVFAAFWAGHYACGRTYSLLRGGVLGRADDITKVKGVLLAPAAIEDVVRSIPGLGDEYEVVVEKKRRHRSNHSQSGGGRRHSDHSRRVGRTLNNRTTLQNQLGISYTDTPLWYSPPLRSEGKKIQRSQKEKGPVNHAGS